MNKLTNYFKASEKFNSSNEQYIILPFIDGDKLEIFMHDKFKEKSYKLSILLVNVKKYSVKNILKQYYSLIDILFNE